MSNPKSYIAILDIGHGNCTVLKDKESISIIDVGARGSGLLEFLTSENIKEIERIFVSHSDQDHIGGLISLLSSDCVKIKEIIVNPDATKKSELWNDLTYELSQQNEKGKIYFHVGISRNNEVINCGEIEILITGPTPFVAAKGVGGRYKKDRIINSNSSSASFHLCWKGKRLVYLAGDIDEIGLEDLIDHEANLNAEILVFPHHGGKSGSYDIEKFTKTLCERVTPSTVIFSIGRNKFDNPRPEIIALVRKLIKDVRISCTQLSTHCLKDVIEKNTPKHLVSFFSKGHSQNHCCGGTFIINLEEGIKVFPEYDPHKEFIKKVIPKSLCLK